MVFVKYVDIERLGTPENETILASQDDTIVVEEKVDGGNGSFWVEDGTLHISSRNRDLTVEKDEKAFQAQQKWLHGHFKDKLHTIDPDFVYYVEHMAKHTIFYGEKIHPVIGLDIKPKEGAFGKKPMFLGRKAKEDEFARVGIPCVALKGIHKVKELTEEKLEEMLATSAYYEGKPEGVVLKNYGRMNVWGNQMFAKIVLDTFKEHNRAVFGGLKQDTSDSIKLVEELITDARIRKRIHALTKEQGLPLSRELMHVLPTSVIQDTFKEEAPHILKNYKTLQLGTLKNVVAKKCLQVIDAMRCEETKQKEED